MRFERPERKNRTSRQIECPQKPSPLRLGFLVRFQQEISFFARRIFSNLPQNPRIYCHNFRSLPVSFSERNNQLTEPQRQDSRRATKTADAGGNLTPERLVREHASAVLGLCIAYTKDFHDGEDIMQEVFLKSFTRIDTLRDHSRARQWLLKIARRMCIDHFRKSRTHHSIAEAETVPARRKYCDEHSARVHAAVARLPEAYRDVISLYYLDGCDCAAVARSLGITNTAVRRRLTRARLMLHELLAGDKS